MTNEEAIQQLFNLESGKCYDTEYIDLECFRIAIKAICSSDSAKAEIYPLKYENLKLTQENSDLKATIKSLRNELQWNFHKFDIEKNELKAELSQSVGKWNICVDNPPKCKDWTLCLIKILEDDGSIGIDIDYYVKDLDDGAPSYGFRDCAGCENVIAWIPRSELTGEVEE